MGFRGRSTAARVRVCSGCHGLQPYGASRRLTAREHWRLGRAFGYRACCIGTFIALISVLERNAWAGSRLLAAYRRLVPETNGWRYLACHVCAWSEARVEQRYSCRCELAA